VLFQNLFPWSVLPFLIPPLAGLSSLHLRPVGPTPRRPKMVKLGVPLTAKFGEVKEASVLSEVLDEYSRVIASYSIYTHIGV
jgi:hypothetical protein